MNAYPIGRNLVEDWMIRQIYEREMAALYKKFILVVLGGSLGCTVQAAPHPPTPPVAPFVCSNTPVRVMVVRGDGTVGPVMALDTAVCVCSDRVVRTC